jgi:hypothetical protein
MKQAKVICAEVAADKKVHRGRMTPALLTQSARKRVVAGCLAIGSSIVPYAQWRVTDRASTSRGIISFLHEPGTVVLQTSGSCVYLLLFLCTPPAHASPAKECSGDECRTPHSGQQKPALLS